MKPTRTSHILRNCLRELNSSIRVDPNGFLTDAVSMPNPHAYRDSRAFAKDYLAYNLARKREHDPAKHGAVAPTQMRNALAKWAESEHRCRVVNQYGGWVFPIDPHERAVLKSLYQRTAAHLSRILMDVWPELIFEPTSGATATTVKSLSYGFTKVDGMPLTFDTPEPHKCAPNAENYLTEMFIANPGVLRRYMRARDKILPGNEELLETLNSDSIEQRAAEISSWVCSNVPPAKLAFVPKDNKEVRLIAQSNSLSIMVQKTFGDAIRGALKHEGVDLNNQTINQEWAEIGSHTGIIATVDLSAASDSISLGMLSVFPKRWQEYFLSCRDSHVSVNGVSHKLNMIAGMGNGYIFELESLLFYAMSLSVVEELGLDASFVSVYGDDIIVPSRAYDLLELFFLNAGFIVNNDKSYSTGPFRESCGKHYFNGVDVSPWFIRSDADGVQDLYHHYNGLTSWTHRTGVDLSKSIKYISDLIPRNEKTLVPLTWDTKAGLHCECDGCIAPKRVWVKRYQRYEYRWTALADSVRDIKDRFSDSLQLTAWLVLAEGRKPLCDYEPLVWSMRTNRIYMTSRLWEPITVTVPVRHGVTRKRYGGESFRGDV